MKLQDLLTKYQANATELRQQGRSNEANQYDELIANCQQMIEQFQIASKSWQPASQA